MENLLQNYYTAISIIIVYHLLSMEHWLSSVSAAADNAHTVADTTATGDIARSAARTRCDSILKRFPFVQITILFIAILALGAIAVDVSLQLRNYKLIYTAGPAFILASVFVFATVASVLRGYGVTRRATARL